MFQCQNITLKPSSLNKTCLHALSTALCTATNGSRDQWLYVCSWHTPKGWVAPPEFKTRMPSMIGLFKKYQSNWIISQKIFETTTQHTIPRDAYGSGMGIVRVRGPILGSLKKSHWPHCCSFSTDFWLLGCCSLATCTMPGRQSHSATKPTDGPENHRFWRGLASKSNTQIG